MYCMALIKAMRNRDDMCWLGHGRLNDYKAAQDLYNSLPHDPLD